MTETVQGTDWGELWAAVKQPDPFTVCFDGNAFCYNVPGWGSPWVLVLGIIEIAWWLFLSAYLGRKLKRLMVRRRKKREQRDEEKRLDNDPY